MYDGMDDTFDATFAVWPERYYLLSNNKIQYIWYPTTEFGFNRLSMQKMLQFVYGNPTVDLNIPSDVTYLKRPSSP